MTTRYHVRLSCLFVAVCCLTLTAPSVRAQLVDNAGTEFFMPYLPNFDATGKVEVHLTSSTTTDVTVNYPVNSPTFTTTVPVVPGDITIVDIPITAASGWTAGVVQNNVVHAFGPDEFVAYMINIRPFSSDAALALPVDTYNTEFIALTYFSNILFSDRSEFAITAPFDNTTVTITPIADLSGGFSAGTPFNVTLDRGDGFLAQGTVSGSAGDLTGSIVESNKPIAMTNGNVCTNVPPGQTFCDHIFEFAHPVQTWGNRALVANLPNLPAGSIYRILASQDNTTVEQDGAVIGTIDRGEFLETDRLPGNHEFSADKPIFVAQYMTGQDPGLGDPAIGNMIPPEQYLSNYTFSTVGGNQFAEHFLTVIAENADVGSVLLDGAAIPAASFSAIGATGFSAAVVPLTDGSHVTTSPGVHGITVEGVNEDDSYIYPGGAQFDFINPIDDLDPPVCELEIVNNVANGTVTDDGPDDTGIFFVTLLAGSVNLNLAVDPFVPGDDQVSYTVTLIDPSQNGSGTVRATDGSGNTCTSNIELQGGDEPPLDTTPPVCELQSIDAGPPVTLNVFVHDPGSGVASIAILTQKNATLEIPEASGNFVNQGDVVNFAPAEKNSFVVQGVKVDPNKASSIAIQVTDDEGNQTTCDPVLANVSAEVPMAFELGRNYPNPFNPTTVIPFQITEQVAVRLVVYDVLGREVATLVDEIVAAGRYEATWDGRNAMGFVVPSGTYLYRLQAGRFVETRTMVFAK